MSISQGQISLQPIGASIGCFISFSSAPSSSIIVCTVRSNPSVLLFAEKEIGGT